MVAMFCLRSCTLADVASSRLAVFAVVVIVIVLVVVIVAVC